MRLFCSVILVVGLAFSAQAAPEDGGRGWSFSGSFNGSSNSDGVVTKAEPVLGYSFNRHFSTYTGIPFYFVNVSSNTTSTTATEGFMGGVGNAFLGFSAGVIHEANADQRFTARYRGVRHDAV